MAFQGQVQQAGSGTYLPVYLFLVHAEDVPQDQENKSGKDGTQQPIQPEHEGHTGPYQQPQ